MAEFQVGDDVEMLEGTALWSSYLHLRDLPGRVTELVDDGTGQNRISVVYPDGTPFVGVDPSFFKPTGPQPAEVVREPD